MQAARGGGWCVGLEYAVGGVETSRTRGYLVVMSVDSEDS
jgi:hypothetical protein